jgi:fructose-1,6-bisphosphatase I
VNDARYFDWPEGLRKYIDTIRQGKGQHPKKYSARYVCSLVADFVRVVRWALWAKAATVATARVRVEVA